jgi:hypothetical protein
MKYKGRPRLSIDLTPEQYQELNELIPWGLKSALFGVIVDDLIEVLKKTKTRRLFIALIMKRKINSLEHLRVKKDLNDQFEKGD